MTFEPRWIILGAAIGCLVYTILKLNGVVP